MILNKNIRLILVFLSMFALQLQIYSQSEVEESITKILGPEIENNGYSIFVYDPLTQDTLYAKNIFANLIPASNVKLYTTATAINLLSPYTSLVTRIFIDDENIQDSVINGNVYIKGFGDALFTEADLDTLVNRFIANDVRRIEGNILADESYFDRVYTRDDWIKDERANVTLPPISGLSIDRNKIVIKFDRNKKVGDHPDYELKPDGRFYDVSMNARLTKFRSTPKISVRTEHNKIKLTVSGGIQQRKSSYSYLVYPDSPAVYVSMLLKDKLIKQGIEVTGLASSGKVNASSSFFAEVMHPISELISDVNKKSDNYLAENLFKILGAEFSLKEGNSFYATQAVITYLDENGIFSDGVNIVDGSGISRFNQTSTASITSLLESIYFDTENFDFFYNSLSIAGGDGTLEDRLFESSAYENFRGKTGSLYGVSSLSGYLTTKSGNDLIIAIIMNDTSQSQNYMRGIQDKIISWCADNL